MEGLSPVAAVAYSPAAFIEISSCMCGYQERSQSARYRSSSRVNSTLPFVNLVLCEFADPLRIRGRCEFADPLQYPAMAISQRIARFRVPPPRGVSKGPGTSFTFAILSSPQGGPHFRHLKAQTMAHFRHLKPKAWPTFAILQAVNIAVNMHIRLDTAGCSWI